MTDTVEIADWERLPASPVVSVCMITYNHERFIAQAIESVLMQETDFPVELVIGEDCSTDGTRAIVVEYAQRYPDRIRPLLREHNMGMIPNFVATLQACRGKYIALLEGDDYWTDPHKLQKQAELLEAHPEWSLCFHKVLMLYEDVSEAPRELCPPDLKNVYTLEDFLTAHLMQTLSIVFRREALTEFPNWFYQAPVGDYPLIALLAQHGAMGYIDECMGVYRVHSGGVWSGRNQIAQIHQKLSILEMINVHLGHQYDAVLQHRVTDLWNQLIGLLVQQELLAASRGSGISKPVRILERCAVTGPFVKLLLQVRGEKAALDYLTNTITHLPPGMKQPARLARLIRARTVTFTIGFEALAQQQPRKAATHIIRGLILQPSLVLNFGVISTLARALIQSTLKKTEKTK